MLSAHSLAVKALRSCREGPESLRGRVSTRRVLARASSWIPHDLALRRCGGFGSLPADDSTSRTRKGLGDIASLAMGLAIGIRPVRPARGTRTRRKFSWGSTVPVRPAPGTISALRPVVFRHAPIRRKQRDANPLFSSRCSGFESPRNRLRPGRTAVAPDGMRESGGVRSPSYGLELDGTLRIRRDGNADGAHLTDLVGGGQPKNGPTETLLHASEILACRIVHAQDLDGDRLRP